MLATVFSLPCDNEICAVLFSWFEDSELRRWSWVGPVFRLPPDHSTLGLITITSIPVWSWSHSVRTLMRNMWSCPDTQSEETQSLTPSFSPLSSSLPPFLFFFLSHSFSLLSRFSVAKSDVFIITHCSSMCVCQRFLMFKTPKPFPLLSEAHRNSSLFFSIVPEQVTHCQQENYTCCVFYLIHTLVIHPLLHSLQLVLELVVYTYLLGHAMQYAHKDMWEERGLSPPIKPDRQSQSFFHVLNSSLPSTWIN